MASVSTHVLVHCKNSIFIGKERGVEWRGGEEREEREGKESEGEGRE